jgi:hypothetical protein
MKIKNTVNPAYFFVDTLNSLSWLSAAMIITAAGLLTLWNIGALFIVLSV